MAEEDLIFGKHRHMFGGIEPSNMQGFRAMRKGSPVRIQATLPNDTVIDGQTLCTVAGAVIRRKTSGYPLDEFDGEKIADITESGIVADISADPEATYYYAAFPYTTQGVYNRNPANRFKYEPVGNYYLFGYDLDTNNSDPSTRVTYPSDVDNAAYTPAHMDFTKGVFEYGGWPNTPGDGFMPKPCMLKFDGTVEYYLNPNNYEQKANGDAAIINATNTTSNAMMEWPKIYTHRELVNGIYKFRCSNTKVANDWECWCNYDVNNKQIDHFYTSIYQGYNTGDNAHFHMRSVARTKYNEKGHAWIGTYFNNYFNGAKANGDDWNMEQLCDILLIQDLLVLMAKTTDCQTAYGTGVVKKQASLSNFNDKGLFYAINGMASTDWAYPVKVFGMESFWGDYGRLIVGWINDNGTHKVKLTPGTHDGSTVSTYNSTGDGYITVPDVVITARGGGYVSGFKIMPYGRIPYEYNGSSSTYECDYVDVNYEDVYPAAVGRGVVSWNPDGMHTGPFRACLNQTSTYTEYTARLSCKPRA